MLDGQALRVEAAAVVPTSPGRVDVFFATAPLNCKQLAGGVFQLPQDAVGARLTLELRLGPNGPVWTAMRGVFDGMPHDLDQRVLLLRDFLIAPTLSMGGAAVRQGRKGLLTVSGLRVDWCAPLPAEPAVLSGHSLLIDTRWPIAFAGAISIPHDGYRTIQLSAGPITCAGGAPSAANVTLRGPGSQVASVYIDGTMFDTFISKLRPAITATVEDGQLSLLGGIEHEGHTLQLVGNGPITLCPQR